jgi:protein-disulfide isomerase
MTRKFDRIASALLTVAAIVMAAAVVRREFFPNSSVTQAGRGTGSAELEFDSAWESMLPAAVVVGERTAPVKLVEFVDFECPVCRTVYERTIQEVTRKYGKQVSVWYVHFPLEIHRFSRIAAQASECAEQQHRFAEFVHAVLTRQDSIGLKSWGRYALSASIPDTVRFVQCIRDVRTDRIDSGVALAGRKRVPGTPTIYANGWRFPNPPLASDVSRVVEDLLSGRKPSLLSQ